MRKSLVIKSFFLLSLGTQALAQNLVLNPNSTNMGDVYETTGDSTLVWAKNTTATDITIKEVRTYNDHYTNQPYSVSIATPFVIPANDSVSFYVKFKPVHNVLHNTEVALVPSSPTGAICLDVKAQGKYSNNYYFSTQNLEEQALKDALNTRLTQTLTGLSYNAARDKMFMEIDNQKFNGQGATQNTIECIYTGRLAIGYTSRTDCQTNYSFNTEHTFPQSLFNSSLPMLGDLHHIFPTDDNANSVRGNNPFADITGSGTWTQGGSVSNGSSFEPRDAQKGRTARALMYFCVKYQDYSCFVQGQENILRTWHNNFPPDNIEKLRNQAVFGAQGNRNPFIDYPQFIQRISKITTCNPPSAGTITLDFDFPKDSINYGDIPISVPTLQRFAIVNTGEDTLRFYNFEIGEQSMEFVDPNLTEIYLPPGEAYYLELNLTLSALGPYQSYIRISNDAINTPYIEVPVTANGIQNIGNETLTQQLVWNIAPNPSKNELTVSALAGGKIEILDVQGKLLKTISLTENHETLKMNEFSAGLYLIKATLNGKTSVKKWWKVSE